MVGLAFVGFEVRNSNSAVRGQTSALIVEGFNTLNSLTISDPDLARVILTAANDPEKVSDVEAMQNSGLTRSYTNQYLQLFRMYENGLLSDEEWLIYASEAKQMLSSPGGKVFLEGNSVALELNSILSDFETTPQAYDDLLGREYSPL